MADTKRDKPNESDDRPRATTAEVAAVVQNVQRKRRGQIRWSVGEHTAELALRAKGARRLSALVERHEAHAVGFWDSLATTGYQRDPRMLRYVKTLDA